MRQVSYKHIFDSFGYTRQRLEVGLRSYQQPNWVFEVSAMARNFYSKEEIDVSHSIPARITDFMLVCYVNFSPVQFQLDEQILLNLDVFIKCKTRDNFSFDYYDFFFYYGHVIAKREYRREGKFFVKLKWNKILPCKNKVSIIHVLDTGHSYRFVASFK